MDISPLFRNSDHDQMMDFLKGHAFGLLVSQGDAHPEASHLPYVLGEEEGEWYLYIHMSASNRHVNFLNEQKSHVFIVQGVDHYISSTWYDHENVPTWNYISVHVIGSLEVQKGADALDNINRLMAELEPPGRSARSMDKLDPERIARHMQGLVTFRMKIQKIEGAKKLSQNRDEANIKKVISELEQLDTPRSLRMAEEMRRNNSFHSTS